MHVDWTDAGRDALDLALARAPLHFSYPLRAVRDEGCRFLFAAQGPGRFDVPKDRPAVVLIGDDLTRALGPDGFHKRSLRRYVERCRCAVIVACEPIPRAYFEAVSWAVVKREDVLIVETRPDHEADWFDFIRLVAPPSIGMLVASVKPEGMA